MSFGLYATMALAVSVLTAYTMRFQGATIAWGKALASNNPLLPRGMQDAITPSSQTVRNLLMFAGWLSVPVVGLACFRWYVGVAALLAVWVCSAVISVCFLPRPDSRFFKNRILHGLRARERAYAAAGDDMRLAAIREVIQRLEGIEPAATRS